MDLYPTNENWTGMPGAIAPADGNTAHGARVAPASVPTRPDESDPFADE